MELLVNISIILILRFMKTEYELTCEDLGYFVEYETEDYKKQQNSQGEL